MASMRCLDKYRLGNQVWREGITLIRGGWPHHPANKMWRGHEYHLGLYLLAGVNVLAERGKNYPEVSEKIIKEMIKFPDIGAPKWLGDEKFHASHRSNLLRKVRLAHEKAIKTRKVKDWEVADYMAEWYSQFNWSEPDDLSYIWPK